MFTCISVLGGTGTRMCLGGYWGTTMLPHAGCPWVVGSELLPRSRPQPRAPASALGCHSLPWEWTVGVTQAWPLEATEPVAPFQHSLCGVQALSLGIPGHLASRTAEGTDMCVFRVCLHTRSQPHWSRLSSTSEPAERLCLELPCKDTHS